MILVSDVMADKYCMYLRKSRKDDDIKSESIEETLARHEKALWELAERNGLTVECVHREVVSGETIEARPVMQQLLKEVEQGMWRGVLVMEVERLARGDTSDQGRVAKAFKYSETLIITPNKIYDPTNEFDEEYFEFGLFMSRRELKTITRRLQQGRIRSVLEGKYVGNTPPYGYRRIKLQGQKGYTLEEEPEEADVVRMIFKWYTDGEKQPDGTNKRLGVSLIVRRLNELKIKPRKDDVWTTPSIRDILINPTYAGKVRWNWRRANKKLVDGKITVERPRSTDYIIADGLHKGIISEETFNRAQELMKQNPPRPVSVRKTVQNPLAGLVICGMCGRRMVRRPYSNGYPDTLMCPVTACKNVSSHLSLVEKRVIEGLKDWLAGYKLKWQIDDNPKKTTKSALDMAHKSLIKLEKNIETIRTQQSNLDDLLEQGVYDIDKYKQRSQILDERIKQAEKDYKELQDKLTDEEQREEARKVIIPKVEKLIETYHALPTPQAKNDLLKEVLEKVVYTKKQGGRWHTSPDDFELVLYPRLPRSNP
jgi:DNA invertase Pin-like site-specific DNA recombinase